jgi:hypothetical protein
LLSAAWKFGNALSACGMTGQHILRIRKSSPLFSFWLSAAWDFEAAVEHGLLSFLQRVHVVLVIRQSIEQV